MFMRAWRGNKTVTTLVPSHSYTAKWVAYTHTVHVTISQTDVIEIDLFDVVVNWNLGGR